MLDFPYCFESERLIVRGPLPGDGTKVREAVLESQPELRQWMPWAVEIPDEDGYEEVIRQGQLRFLSREDLWMLLFLKGGGTLVGGSGLHSIRWEVPSFEIGYWVRTSYSGQGLITEAVNAITAFAFNELNARRVQIRCDSLNERSAAVARRAGFELEAVIHNDDRHHLTNALRHTLVFAKIRT